MKIIRLTENDIMAMVKNSVDRILAEKHVLKLPNADKQEAPMDAPMDDFGMDDPMQGQGGMPPMDDGMGDGAMDNADGGGMGNDEISQIMDKLSTEQQSSVIKYAKSMIDDEEDADAQPNENQQDMPMYENNIVFDKREEPRKKKEIGNPNKRSPFISNR